MGVTVGVDFCARLGIEIPIVQAPMAGSGGVALAIAVAQAGGLGSLPAAMLSSAGSSSRSTSSDTPPTPR